MFARLTTCAQFEEARRFGANHVVSTADAAALKKSRVVSTFMINTVNGH